MEFQEITVHTWLDRVAISVGFGRVVEWLPIKIAPSTAAVSMGVFIDLVLLSIYQELTGTTPSFVRNPLVVVIPLTVLVGVVISRDIQHRYQSAIREMHIHDRTANPAQFETLCSDRLRWVAFLLGASTIVLNTAVFVTIPVILETGGVAALVGNFLIVPLFYAPVAVDFIVTFFSIQLLLPRRIRRSDFELDFLDPEGLGGLRPIGELIKHTYYYFVIGAVAVALFIYGPWIIEGPVSEPVRPSPIVDGLFTVGWLVGAGSVGHALYVFHRFMNEEKRKRLHELNTQYRELLQNPWNIAEHSIPEGKQEEAEKIQERMIQITSTREYPATFSMWTQLIISIILPKAVQMVLNSI